MTLPCLSVIFLSIVISLKKTSNWIFLSGFFLDTVR